MRLAQLLPLAFEQNINDHAFCAFCIAGLFIPHVTAWNVALTKFDSIRVNVLSDLSPPLSLITSTAACSSCIGGTYEWYSGVRSYHFSEWWGPSSPLFKLHIFTTNRQHSSYYKSQISYTICSQLQATTCPVIW
jgi:hypothetical protein